MAGRLCFSVTLAASRTGSAFMKPCDAQQFCPMQGGMISVRLYMAMRWFIKLLRTRAPAEMTGVKAETIQFPWHDAAGASRWVAAVLRARERVPLTCLGRRSILGNSWHRETTSRLDFRNRLVSCCCSAPSDKRSRDHPG